MTALWPALGRQYHLFVEFMDDETLWWAEQHGVYLTPDAELRELARRTRSTSTGQVAWPYWRG